MWKSSVAGAADDAGVCARTSVSTTLSGHVDAAEAADDGIAHWPVRAPVTVDVDHHWRPQPARTGAEPRRLEVEVLQQGAAQAEHRRTCRRDRAVEISTRQ